MLSCVNSVFGLDLPMVHGHACCIHSSTAICWLIITTHAFSSVCMIHWMLSLGWSLLMRQPRIQLVQTMVRWQRTSPGKAVSFYARHPLKYLRLMKLTPFRRNCKMALVKQWMRHRRSSLKRSGTLQEGGHVEGGRGGIPGEAGEGESDWSALCCCCTGYCTLVRKGNQ